MTKSVLQIITQWSIAIMLVSPSIINIIANLVNQQIADSLNSTILYWTTFLSFLCIPKSIMRIRNLIYALIIILMMAISQKYFVPPVDDEMFKSFFIHGLGAIFIGYSIYRYKDLIKKISNISFCLCIVLLFEPITHAYMNLGNMSTGYLLSPLAIWLFTQYYITPQKKYLLIVSIPLSLLIVFFCSRGCGLSIIIAVLLLKLWDNHQKGIRAVKFVRWIITFGFVGYVILNIAIKYIENHSRLMEGDSSFIARIIYGGANESSGRDMIWNSAIEMLNSVIFVGWGMGNDRPMIYSMFGVEYVHNIILEVLLNFGIVFGLFLIFIFCKSCYKSLIESSDRYYGFFLISLVSMYVIRLLFSGSYLSSSFEIFFIVGIVSRSLDISKITTRKHSLYKSA